MSWIEVCVEGASDVPAVREVLTRRFGLAENINFRIHAHRGKGRLPTNPLKPPEIRHQGLLDVLPAKLRGWGKSLPQNAAVLVVVDVDDTPCHSLLSDLQQMLKALPAPVPRVLFRLAIEETESWFIADIPAMKKAYPGKLKVAKLTGILPDSIIGASERLAGSIGIPPDTVTGLTKMQWAQRIVPHLNLQDAPSPSLRKLVSGVERLLDEVGKSKPAIGNF
ncbi:DUF4276 family protein [Xylophilus ampelinus]|uniref:Uncharacterized protein DUF4276 n=1 Tax=Xylophilus ampelinus TaxID=54067 RepID=A0A318STZ6_9BURK|nr:DUF4276 family protein [Xylophilus ampelinus]MCS4510251.1 DUF4276 family protein [Xylophilus ampelinus]PYE78127.1 uncharacterized protein DUF4276 [Xylophilus ampelinus]